MSMKLPILMVGTYLERKASWLKGLMEAVRMETILSFEMLPTRVEVRRISC